MFIPVLLLKDEQKVKSWKLLIKGVWILGSGNEDIYRVNKEVKKANT